MSASLSKLLMNRWTVSNVSYFQSTLFSFLFRMTVFFDPTAHVFQNSRLLGRSGQRVFSKFILVQFELICKDLSVLTNL